MVWAALAGVWVARGDQDRGLVQWLGARVSRARLLLARSAAFGLVALVACLAAVLGIVLAAPLVHQDANPAGELGKGISIAAGVVAACAIALFLAQLRYRPTLGVAQR